MPAATWAVGKIGHEHNHTPEHNAEIAGLYGRILSETAVWLRQARDAAGEAQCVLIRLEVVTRNLCVHGTLQQEP